VSGPGGDGAFATVAIDDGVATAVVNPRHAARLCDGHFPGDPLLPGSALVALMADLGARLVADRCGTPRPVAIPRCVFVVPVTPVEPITVVARRRPDALDVEAEVRLSAGRAAYATILFAPGG
jgi:3-hydroxymyristoyl/3-hydroxydecanoyl-(acyl carrier protein) dehydratase